MSAEAPRSCLGCRQVRHKASMLRLVRGDDGRARLDRRQRESGRGAYVCPSTICLEAALTRSRLGHAFRRPTEPPAEPAILIRDILA